MTSEKINKLVAELAAAYLTEQGSKFTHKGIVFHVAGEALRQFLFTQLVGSFMAHAPTEHQGRADTTHAIGNLILKDGAITPFGVFMVGEVLRFCCGELLDTIREEQLETERQSVTRVH